MKKLVFSIVGLFPLLLFAQKYDNNWRLGYGANSIYSQGNIVLTFDDDGKTDTIKLANSSLDPGGRINISSLEGELLFTYNGKYLENKNFEIIDTLYDYAWINNAPQNSIILPYPDHPNRYVLIHSDNSGAYGISAVTDLFYSILDRTLDNGNGGVAVRKENLLLDNRFSYGQITATRHANGRDWWILVNKYDSNKFYTFLLTPEGLSLYLVQEVEDFIESGLGQANFSPNGQFYAVHNVINPGKSFLDIFNFDRCTGLLSNQQKIPLQGNHEAGVCFSPNSRFLYLTSSFREINQFDLSANDLVASRVSLGEFDNWQSVIGLYPFYYQMQLAPNGKIYFCTSNGQKLLHVIEEPNKKGLACNFRPHGLELPTWNGNLPSFPNFRLGPVEGSSCDSLGLNNLPIAKWSYRLDSFNYHQVYFQEYSDFMPDTYLWDFGDGQMSSDPEPKHDYGMDGNYDVCLIVTNTNSSDTLCRTVTIDSSKILFPKAKILLDTFGCWPETVYLTAKVENADYFEWEYVNGPTVDFYFKSTDSILAINYFEPGTRIVHLTAYNALGSTKVMKRFTMFDQPKAVLGVSNFGNEYSFKGFNSKGVALDYYFDFGDGNAGYYDSKAKHTFGDFGTYNVSLIVSNDCGSDTATQTIVLDSSSFDTIFPFVLIQADTLSGCIPLTVEYQAITFNVDSLTWSFPGGSPAMAHTDNVIVTYDSIGVYKAEVAVIGIYSFTDSASKEVTAYSGIPVANFTFGISNQTITTHNQSINATTYLWDFGDGLTDISPNPVHTFAQPGNYDIVLIATNDCGSDTISRNLLITTIINPDIGMNFSIFPNPSSGLFVFETTSDLAEKLDLTIYNLLGQVILRKQLALGEQIMDIDLESQASGIYWYRIDYDGKIGWGKLVKEANK